MSPTELREGYANQFGIAMPWKAAEQEAPVQFTETKRGTMVSFLEKAKSERAVELLVVLAVVGVAVYMAGKEVEKRVD